jgi:hypothetical protein
VLHDSDFFDDVGLVLQAPTLHHAANLLKAFFHFEIKIDKILESAKFPDAAGTQHGHCAPYCVS